MKYFLLCPLGCAAVLFCAALISGCATPGQPPCMTDIPSEITPQDIKGIQHKVEKGQTLWRIARTYEVTIEEIIAANGIPNAASIETGQLVFIPGADALREVALPSDIDGESGDYLWPLKGRIFSFFEDKKDAYISRGIDIQTTEGAPVLASRAGRVVFADHLAGYGHTLILEHADGFFTVYGHLDPTAFNPGAQVSRGERIARLAGDGRTDVFFHFEIRKGDEPHNPLHYLPREM